jgi:hypothetical protein
MQAIEHGDCHNLAAAGGRDRRADGHELTDTLMGGAPD